ncbi:hypothetical protein ALC57_12852 [Trachymyrmex cornetzi]|uniref:Uncharacterized protein n=1 Tax=Trachymyrmex cornetzi TaxID=471704 RepID=A0A151J0B6_9HYME|nr:hypothetical protein ALC57_12852 [Trachymyrmex cornetzi]
MPNKSNKARCKIPPSLDNLDCDRTKTNRFDTDDTWMALYHNDTVGKGHFTRSINQVNPPTPLLQPPPPPVPTFPDLHPLDRLV